MNSFDRYHRQTLFQPIGVDGQEKMMNAHVLIVGCGALGSSVAEMLTRAGIGKLTLIDRDYVEETNLQRQHLFTEQDAYEQQPKSIAAKEKLEKINRNVEIESIVGEANAYQLEQSIDTVNVIIDATDNFDTRFLINDVAHKHDTPWIFGACVSSSGMTFTMIPKQTPCLSCLLHITPTFGATCDAVGIISPAIQMVVSHQVTEALKLITEDHENLQSAFTLFDLWKNQYQTINVTRAKRPDCPTCGKQPTFPALRNSTSTKIESLCGRDTVQIRGRASHLIN
ncbi:thiamine/molybdopterin biosynthesis ThiF/MoeB-like protein [Gracilibacillus halophilus YIM-C55.5]|uniref:Thiamine/molybdopterin biosynthesis ThiF/MoeB-like protein n=1 Tax=Gracilibacillus halophilus YIM-C55.5 TaxID=1308866 RepID=N4WRW0_9BACI|nr:thiamine/molybdopterin biosynthesis ThiF/MoeB-like protein [Gracilibacillus halophilus YIM-C55.5]